MKIHETGNWSVGSTDKGKTVFIESNDFTHDVRLYVNGDFTGPDERLAYAEEIAQRLNIATEMLR